LFDLRSDPQEVKNLWDDSVHVEKKRELHEVLLRWRIESDVHTAEWAAAWR
jgi:hypothetical protein